MKKIYETPEMEVIAFDSEDVITTSGLETSGLEMSETPSFNLSE